jgi:3-dehydroquinate synthase
MGIARGCVSWTSPVVAQRMLVRPFMLRVRAAAAESVMTTVTVDLGDRTYPIYIGSHLTDKPELLTDHIRGKRALVVTNETIAPLYLDKCVLLCARHHQHEHVQCFAFKSCATKACFVFFVWRLQARFVDATSIVIEASNVYRIQKALESKLQVETVVLQDGEQFKSLDELQKVWDKALQARLDRGTRSNCPVL